LKYTNCIVGMQDMGAAGIACSTSEMSAKKGLGMKIDLSKVPARQEGMKPFEFLLSESQERMLIVVEKGKESEVQRIFDKWDLNCAQIGEVTDTGWLEYYFEGELVGYVPADSLVLGGGAPVYKREWSEPAYFAETKKFSIDSLSEPSADEIKKYALQLLAQPNIASKRWIYEQYDSMVGTINMGTNKPSDAGIVNLKGTDAALAMSVDCNSRYVFADPETGCAIAVSEAARNITCSGGEPSAITNCLNFGNPYNPEVYWQFVGSIKGMGKACLKFGTPVTGGNVSFYNQSASVGKAGGNVSNAVFPTPTIGMIGVVREKEHVMTLDFKEKGDLIFLIGEMKNDVNSSEYLYNLRGVKLSPAPHFDLDKEFEMQQSVKALIRGGFINAAHDISDGGLWVTLAEMGMPRGLGFDIESDSELRLDAFLFGESQGRVVVTVSEEAQAEFIEFMATQETPFTLLGHVTKGKMVVDGEHYGFVHEVKPVYDNSLGEKIMSN